MRPYMGDAFFYAPKGRGESLIACQSSINESTSISWWIRWPRPVDPSR